MSKFYHKGFTLIELLLSMSFMAVLIAGAVPVYQTFQKENDLNLATATIAQALNRAKLMAESGIEDSGWSINVQNNEVMIYKGNNFANRDTNFDENFTLPATVLVSGLLDENFAHFSGIPQQLGKITVASDNGKSTEISINDVGLVDY